MNPNDPTCNACNRQQECADGLRPDCPKDAGYEPYRNRHGELIQDDPETW